MGQTVDFVLQTVDFQHTLTFPPCRRKRTPVARRRSRLTRRRWMSPAPSSLPFTKLWNTQQRSAEQCQKISLSHWLSSVRNIETFLILSNQLFFSPSSPLQWRKFKFDLQGRNGWFHYQYEQLSLPSNPVISEILRKLHSTTKYLLNNFICIES